MSDTDLPPSLEVEFYRGPRSGGTLVATGTVAQLCGGGVVPTLCFTVPTPAVLKTGAQESVHAYVQDADAAGVPNGFWTELVLSPRLLTCAP